MQSRNKRHLNLGIIFCLTTLVVACASSPARLDPPTRYSSLAGLYVAGPLAITEVVAVDEYVAVRPPFWGGRPYFASAPGNKFIMTLPHTDPDRWVAFSLTPDGRGESLRFDELHPSFDGIEFMRLGNDEDTPARLFFERHPERAARAALRDPQITIDMLYDFIFQQFMRYPSRQQDSLRFIETVLERYPDHAPLTSLLGLAFVSNGDRERALNISQRALRLDPQDERALETIRRLTLAEPEPGEGYRAVLPFRLSVAHDLPTAVEIREVQNDWAGRDLVARSVEIVDEFDTEFSGVGYRVQIIQHEISGETHFGAAFIPDNADSALPVVIDARGVNPEYSPVNLDAGTQLIRAMGDSRHRYIFLVPAMNGHTLQANGVEYIATGDPSDAWDGATDATLGFLNAALSVIPEARRTGIAVFGHSRGGTVALLAGIRDPRISLVISVSGPVDHFQAMNSYLGWTSAELLMDAMSDGLPATLDEEGGQDFDHFFDRVITDGESLAGVRHRMLASSPVYFAGQLPETHAYFGADDRSVPIVNAIRLRDALDASSPTSSEFSVHIYPDLGHDTDNLFSWRGSVLHLDSWVDQLPAGR